MLLKGNRISKVAFERGTGWSIRPEGACRGDLCVPFSDGSPDEDVDVVELARRLGMSVVRHSDDLAAVGPATLGGRALSSAVAPDLVLPDFSGNEFDLRTLRGQKVVLVAWSPY
jgi:hypothetical protein